MLPEFLGSTYKKYKQDTSTFIQWLYEHAQKCGYQVKNSTKPDDTTPPKAPRLKGKARKQAKQTPFPKPIKEKSPEQVHLVETSELLPLAKAIASSPDPDISVPTNIVRAGLRAISARKRCTSHFKSMTSSGDAAGSEQNETHAFFTGLMEEVILALQPRFASNAGSAAASTESFDATISNLSNRFEALEVEESAQDEDFDVSAETRTSPTPPSAVYELIPSKSEEEQELEKLFAVFCLFDDLAQLRVFVSDIWLEYRAGKIDLITASITTNTALQLAERIQTDSMAAHGGNDYNNIMTLLVDMLAKQQGDSDEIEMDDDLAEWIYAPAHSFLDKYCDDLKPNKIPMTKGVYGKYHADADRSTMTRPEQLMEDLIIVMGLLEEVCILQRHRITPFTCDEITRGLMKMIEEKAISVWHAFAATAWLDIHHIIRGKASDGCRAMLAEANRVKSDVKDYLTFSQSVVHPTTWPKQNDQVLRQFLVQIEKSILADTSFLIKTQVYNGRNQSIGADEKFYLYKQHPILAGMISFHLILKLQEIGITLVNAWGTVVYPAHFYNALLINNPNIKRWVPMDKVIELHEEGSVFVGAAPDTFSSAFKQVCFMLGYAPENFARNRRNFKPVVSKKGPRGLRETSPLGEIFHAGLDADGSMELTLHNVEQLLLQQVKNAELAADPRNKALRMSWKISKRLTPVQFLETLKASVPVELPKLRFDYLSLHKESFTLLRKIKTALDADFKSIIGNQYIENESQLPFLGPYTLIVADNMERVTKKLNAEHTENLLLTKIGAIFEAHLSEIEIEQRAADRNLVE